MNAQINQLVRSLFRKDSIEQCSVQELQQYADRHPYFGAAQLLLTKKLKDSDPNRYEEHLQKTLLFFHNPLWVEQLLNETGNAVVQKTEATATIVTPIATEPVPVPETEIVPVVTEAMATSPGETSSPVEEIQKPAKEELLFEPFHTVDYFASQGIKFREEEKPRDKFGLQLKSFTEWLKTMKRLPVAEIAAKTDSGGEQNVEKLAETSLESKEVLTEAMAEVWEKQGNAEKAIGIYSKLSLLEPSKSTYFAAKIEELKKKN